MHKWTVKNKNKSAQQIQWGKTRFMYARYPVILVFSGKDEKTNILELSKWTDFDRNASQSGRK